MPKAFYHPSGSRDVDNNVCIQGPERKENISRKTVVENGYRAGSTFHLKALPLVSNMMAYGNANSNNNNNNNNAQLFHSESPLEKDAHCSSSLDETLNSAMLNSTQLTSSIEEKERGEQKQDKSISIQNYLHRFRYSAPKSREDRLKENNERKKDLWWMRQEGNDNLAVENNKQERGEQGLSKSKHERLNGSGSILSSKQGGGPKLTREAVLELDKETLNLQQKADMLLSRSELSFASSGPCVSTDGLGSSTTSALSECSYKLDHQPAYRPIFVNLQEENMPDFPTRREDTRHHQMEEPTKPVSPGDVLARWRMRRKAELSTKSKHVSRVVNNKPQSAKLHNEADIRLEEFRKKLFAQRTLVTSEDIQFERQKMNMLLDDDKESPRSKEIVNPQPPQNGQSHLQRNHAQSNPQEDLILSRLRQITSLGDSVSNDVVDSTNVNTDCTIYNQAACSITRDLRNVDSNNSNASTTRTQNTTSSLHSSNNKIPDISNPSVERLNNDNYNNQQHSTQQSQRPYRATFSDQRQSCHDVPCQTDSPLLPQTDTSISIPLNDNTNKQSAFILIQNTKKLPIDESSNNSNRFASNDKQGEVLPTNISSHSNTNTSHFHQRLVAEKPCADSKVSDDNIDVNSSNIKRIQNVEVETKDKRSASPSSSIHCVDNDNDSVRSDRSNSSSSKNKRHKESKVISKNESEKQSGRVRNNDKLLHSNANVSSNSSIRSESSHHADTATVVNIKTVIPESLHQEKEKVMKESKDSESNKKAGQKIPISASSPSRSLHHSKLGKAIGETVVDHLFDGPSMISSVDSWASLFPHSPSQSYHNSTIITTPIKETSTSTTATNQHYSTTSSSSTPLENESTTGESLIMEEISNECDNESEDSIEEYQDDPLMSLLLKQKKDYLHKIQLIDMKLQNLD